MLRERRKKGIIEDYLIWIILAVFVLGLSFLVIVILKGQGVTLIDKIKSLISGR